MTPRRQALATCLVAAMYYVSRCQAGNWGMDATFGVLGDYSSDPSLLHRPDTELTSAAVQLAAPISYDNGQFKFSTLPNVRIGTDSGYDAVTSDYEHLDFKGEYNSDRNSLSADAGLAQDSSLTYSFLTNGETGVRRDALTGELKWNHSFTERLASFLSVDQQRVEFTQHQDSAQLSDYGYTGISSGLSWNGSERDKLTLQVDTARYYTFDTRDEFGYPTSTDSRSGNLQIGFVHHLSELWTLTLLGGYSREIDRTSYNIYVPFLTQIFAFPTTQDTGTNSPVYSATLSHSGSRLNFDATVSRQYLPSGFAYLTRQDSYDLKANYALSERWSAGGDARYIQYQQPAILGNSPEIKVRYVSLNASWHWTELWVVTLTATRLSESYVGNPNLLASNEVILTLSRQFGHITF